MRLHSTTLLDTYEERAIAAEVAALDNDENVENYEEALMFSLTGALTFTPYL